MKNYVQSGEVISLVAPYTVNPGDGLLVGSIFAVASGAAEIGTPVEGATTGVYDIPKTAVEAWTAGSRVYWDDAARLATTVATDNTLIGVAILPAANPSGVGRVRLNGSF